MADAPVDGQALLTVLTTEHFTLQGARASTVSESSARAALFVGAVSSTLVALGFIAQASELGSAFDTFVLVVLPTLYVLGLFTFVRLVTSSTEDLLYGRAINRIRNNYQEVAGDEARYLLMGGHDDTLGVLANMGIATVALAAVLRARQHGRGAQRGRRRQRRRVPGGSRRRDAGPGSGDRRRDSRRLVLPALSLAAPSTHRCPASRRSAVPLIGLPGTAMSDRHAFSDATLAVSEPRDHVDEILAQNAPT
jgi:hypothetical protein